MEEPESKVIEITFAEILPVWQQHLWADRKSVIEPISCIQVDGTIDMNIPGVAIPRFVGCRGGSGEIQAVASGHCTSPRQFRLRGFWVDPALRGQGLGRQLVEHLVKPLSSEETAWVMARPSAEGFYARCGFRSRRVVTSYEFGPHIIMVRSCWEPSY